MYLYVQLRYYCYDTYRGSQGDGERNFHIFYQMLAGGEAARLKISKDPKSYAFLNQGNAETVKGMNDTEGFREVVQGLTFVGFADADRKAMFELLYIS